jgi:dihydrofolate reductase
VGGHGQLDAEDVGSTTLSGALEWNATLLEGDLADSIPKLTNEVDGDLFMHGSGEFAYALAEKGLIDEYEVYLNPLVWGHGNSTCSATEEPFG